MNDISFEYYKKTISLLFKETLMFFRIGFVIVLIIVFMFTLIEKGLGIMFFQLVGQNIHITIMLTYVITWSIAREILDNTEKGETIQQL